MKFNKYSVANLLVGFMFATCGLLIITSGSLPLKSGASFFFGEYKNLVGGIFIIISICVTYLAIKKNN